MIHKGQCHCGDIKFSFDGPEINSGIICNCSMCIRKGTVMSSFSLDENELEIQAKAGATAVYQFGTDVAKHYFCKNCGVYPFHQTRHFPGKYKINLACIDGVDTYSLETELLDGAAV